jgi:hypothetical protein
MAAVRVLLEELAENILGELIVEGKTTWRHRKKDTKTQRTEVTPGL